MKRSVVRAFLVGVACVFVYYIILALRGMYLTNNYVPDIINSYDSVDYLQQKVAFGIAIEPVRIVLEVSGLLLLGMAIYFVVRKLRRKAN